VPRAGLASSSPPPESCSPAACVERLGLGLRWLWLLLVVSAALGRGGSSSLEERTRAGGLLQSLTETTARASERPGSVHLRPARGLSGGLAALSRRAWRTTFGCVPLPRMGCMLPPALCMGRTKGV
jgi:hypothetical protein